MYHEWTTYFGYFGVGSKNFGVQHLVGTPVCYARVCGIFASGAGCSSIKLACGCQVYILLKSLVTI